MKYLHLYIQHNETLERIPLLVCSFKKDEDGEFDIKTKQRLSHNLRSFFLKNKKEGLYDAHSLFDVSLIIETIEQKQIASFINSDENTDPLAASKIVSEPYEIKKNSFT